MSGLDQPIVIANSNYHVGQERSFRVAEEQGFLKEEGLDRYVYERGGLIPGQLEFEGLGQIMWERGIDIATAVDVRAAVLQRARGADVYIVGGWRLQLAPRLVGAKGITRPEQLKGGTIAVREKWGLQHVGLTVVLRTFGLDPEKDIQWIEDPVVGYGSEGVEELLRSGKVTALPLNGNEANALLDEGYSLTLDVEKFYRSRGSWPPGKVIVATRQTVEHRGQELRALLRANLRGFWFVQNPKNHPYMFDLESRMRQTTYNEDERRLRMLKTEAPEPRPAQLGPRATGYMPMDGLVPRPALQGVIDGMSRSGQVPGNFTIDDVLKDRPSIDAFDQLVSRGIIDLETVERWRGAEV